VTVLEIHGLFVGIPLLIVAILSAMIFTRKGPHPASYKMADKWTHEPILWAAVDEKIGHGHGHSTLTVGGGASGKW